MPLCSEKINQYLNTKFIGSQIICLDTISSTNDYLKEFGKDFTDEGIVVTANQQTGGKGRLGRTWSAEKDSSIAMSILLKPSANIKNISVITMLAAVSVVDGVLNSTGINTKIKWPNDIYFDDKKLCGILAESSFSNNKLEYIVLGIGVNVNQVKFDDNLAQTATSLKKICGKEFDRELIISNILNTFEINYDLFKLNDLIAFMDKLKRYSCILGKEVSITGTKTEKVIGKAVDITETGSILIKLQNGEIKEFINGEVSLRFKS